MCVERTAYGKFSLYKGRWKEIVQSAVTLLLFAVGQWIFMWTYFGPLCTSWLDKFCFCTYKWGAGDNEVDSRTHQPSVIEFLYKIGDDSGTTIRRKLLIGISLWTVAVSSDGLQRFTSGDFSLLDQPRSGRPASARDDVNKDAIDQQMLNHTAVGTWVNN